VQALSIDVWAEPGQAAIFEELSAMFGQWRMERKEMQGAVRFRFIKQAQCSRGFSLRDGR
jgi:hypothetical protein